MSVIEWLKEWVIVIECMRLWSNVCDCAIERTIMKAPFCETTNALIFAIRKVWRPPNFTCRIISVEGTKAVINSTITPNMTFTKTSQKFGQWSDVRANTVYGLGRYTALRCSCDKCCGSVTFWYLRTRMCRIPGSVPLSNGSGKNIRIPRIRIRNTG